jgi:transcriptional regulator with XRE-family HTH domain
MIIQHLPIDGKFAIFIERERKALNITQTKLAERAGINRSTISMMFKHKAEPRLDHAIKLLNGVGKSFNDFEQYVQEQPWTSN